MNYGMLNKQEILRIAQPETELEVKLFEILTDGFDEDERELEAARSEIEEYSSQADDLENQISNLDTDNDNLTEKVEALVALLDENEIDHSEI